MDDTELLQVLDYLSTNNFILHNHKDDVRHMIRHIYGPDFDSSFSKIVMDYGQSSFLFPDDKARLKKVITTGAKLMRNVTKRERRLKRMNQHSKKKQDYLILLQNSYEPSLPVEDKKMLNKKIRNLTGYLRETLYFIDLEAAFIYRLKHGRKNRKAIDPDDVVPEVSREEKTTLWDILENRVKTATTVLDNFVKSHFQRSNQNEDQSDGNQNSQEAEIKVKTTELFDIVYPDFDKGQLQEETAKAREDRELHKQLQLKYFMEDIIQQHSRRHHEKKKSKQAENQKPDHGNAKQPGHQQNIKRRTRRMKQ